MIVRLDQTWPDDVPLLPIPTLAGPSPQVMSTAPPNKPDAIPLYAVTHIAGGAAPLTSHYFSRPGAASSSYYVAAAPLAIVVVVVLIYPLVSLLLLTSLGSCLVLYKRAKDKEEEEYQRKQEKEENEQEGAKSKEEQHEKTAPGAAEKKPARDAIDSEPSAKKPREDIGANDKPADGPASPRLLQRQLDKDDSPQSPLRRARTSSKELYGYCRSFMPQLMRAGQPFFMDSSLEAPEADLSSCSKRTKSRVIALGNYLKGYYASHFEYIVARRQRQRMIERHIRKAKLSEEEARYYRAGKAAKETLYLRLRRTRIRVNDFQVLSLLGRGGYGEVFLCRHRESGEVVALKRMKKSVFINKNEVPRVKREKEVMAKLKSGKENPWMINLISSFQDAEHLYLCMEYLPGGDLRNLLDNMGRLSEDHARLYIAEVILAVEALHQLGYIHRDLKPNNFLIDKKGHLRLIDFGLSKEGARKNVLKTRRVSLRFDVASLKASHHSPEWAYSMVGSPEYMAPEIVGVGLADSKEKGYDETADWWSVGILLFEMIYGYTPFMSDTVEEIFYNISTWKEVLQFPDLASIGEDEISPPALDLMKRLICDPEVRLGKTAGAEDIKSHAFFDNFDWRHIRSLTPPFVPKLQNEWDTTYFNVANMDNMATDIGQLVEMELKSQAITTRPGGPGGGTGTDSPKAGASPQAPRRVPLGEVWRRSTHFASKDDNLFAGFTFYAPPDATATLKGPKKNSKQHQMMKEMIKDKVNKMEIEGKQATSASTSDPLEDDEDDTSSEGFTNAEVSGAFGVSL
ncbi:Serine/threonine kinase [Acanthamoeba castellanii str. Neff]|uniref:non-specific serine/threonine protein kinase n=1 Tax=Acanthamoeba castellanii (strain ATCC 30010 / Neff) TaxID=1257118 RepID=L8GWW2_ACACF|nr:Serine/threonine kinase [Acanthamoeba castellanii str. Neff]ELR17437.1 Serine/threonine kinase [Acanthamoeba castellanii str. Neff]